MNGFEEKSSATEKAVECRRLFYLCFELRAVVPSAVLQATHGTKDSVNLRLRLTGSTPECL